MNELKLYKEGVFVSCRKEKLSITPFPKNYIHQTFTDQHFKLTTKHITTLK